MEILIVDDEPEVRRCLKRFLESRAFDVQTAANGKEAIRRIENQLPDLVLCDVIMEGMSGIELLRRVRLSHAEMPFILMSGSEEIESESLCGREKSAFAYLRKPVRLQTLLECIERLGRRQWSRKNRMR